MRILEGPRSRRVARRVQRSARGPRRRRHAVPAGRHAVPVGVGNGSLARAVREQPDFGTGERFESFVIARQCETFVRSDAASGRTRKRGLTMVTSTAIGSPTADSGRRAGTSRRVGRSGMAAATDTTRSCVATGSLTCTGPGKVGWCVLLETSKQLTWRLREIMPCG